MTHEIAMISDIHFGCRGNSEKYIDTMLLFFKETLSKVLRERKIDDLRILGDLFDNRNAINVRTINAVIEVFDYLEKEFPKLKIKILMGNHDQYYHNRYDIISLNILRNHRNVEIIDKVVEETINGKSILTVPWIVPETTAYEDFLKYSRAEEKIDLVLGHFEIHGFEITPGIFDVNGFPVSAFKSFKRVFSGHFHIRNTMENVTYLGCPYQLTWGDYGNMKGIHIYDIDSDQVTFIENNDSPQFVKVSMTDLAAGKKEELAKVAGNFVKLIVDKKYKDTAVHQVIALIESKGAMLTVDNQYVEQTDIQDNGAVADLSKMNDPLSFLLEYIKIIDIPEDIKSIVDKKDVLDKAREAYQKTISEKD